MRSEPLKSAHNSYFTPLQTMIHHFGTPGIPSYLNLDISFRHLGSQLSEMKNVIERMMEADFVDFAIANLNAPSKPEADGLYEEV